MKNFDDFKTVVHDNYSQIRDKTEQQVCDFVEKHDCSQSRANQVYSELFAFEMLRLYHEWINS